MQSPYIVAEDYNTALVDQINIFHIKLTLHKLYVSVIEIFFYLDLISSLTCFEYGLDFLVLTVQDLT